MCQYRESQQMFLKRIGLFDVSLQGDLETVVGRKNQLAPCEKRKGEGEGERLECKIDVKFLESNLTMYINIYDWNAHTLSFCLTFLKNSVLKPLGEAQLGRHPWWGVWEAHVRVSESKQGERSVPVEGSLVWAESKQADAGILMEGQGGVGTQSLKGLMRASHDGVAWWRGAGAWVGWVGYLCRSTWSLGLKGSKQGEQT